MSSYCQTLWKDSESGGEGAHLCLFASITVDTCVVSADRLHGLFCLHFSHVVGMSSDICSILMWEQNSATGAR